MESLVTRARVYWTWRRQGRPRHVPVPKNVGTLMVRQEPSCAPERIMADWDLSGRYMKPGSEVCFDDPKFMLDLWNHLSRFYRVDIENLEEHRDQPECPYTPSKRGR